MHPVNQSDASYRLLRKNLPAPASATHSRPLPAISCHKTTGKSEPHHQPPASNALTHNSSTSTFLIVSSPTGPFPFLTFSPNHHGDQNHAHEAWLQCHSLHLETETLVLTTIFHHRSHRSSFTLPKITKNHIRPKKKTCHHCGSSSTVRVFLIMREIEKIHSQKLTPN